MINLHPDLLSNLRVMKKINLIDGIALVVVIAAAINWGLIGLFSFDIVSYLFSFSYVAIRAVYIIVGLAGVYMLYMITRLRKK
jgi:uncharacterized membrane protein YuzA (DUF378 family)